jgi:hypothetical protein
VVAGPSGGVPSLGAIVQGNSLTVSDPAARDALRLSAASGTSVCADLGGAGGASNTLQSTAGRDLTIGQAGGSTVRLPGYLDGPNDLPAVLSFLGAQNLSFGNGLDGTASGGYVGGAPCTAPTVPA